MALLRKYDTCKSEVLKSIGDKNISHIKKHFMNEISSIRSYNRIFTVKELLAVLEERDSLNEKNVSCLKEIAKLTHNENMKCLIQTYEKFNLLDEPACSLCCEVQDAVPSHLVLSPPEPPILQNSRFSYMNSPTGNDLDTAITALSMSLGCRWPALLRVLGVKECLIDVARKKFPNDFDQAHFALNWWCQINNNASIDTLQNALKKRECRRLGLGPDLIKMQCCFVTLSS